MMTSRCGRGSWRVASSSISRSLAWIALLLGIGLVGFERLGKLGDAAAGAPAW